MSRAFNKIIIKTQVKDGNCKNRYKFLPDNFSNKIENSVLGSNRRAWSLIYLLKLEEV